MRRLKDISSKFAINLFESFLPVVLMPLIVVCGIFYITYWNVVENVIKNYNYNIAVNLSATIDQQLVSLTQMCNDFIYTTDVQELVIGNKLYPYEKERWLAMENLDGMRSLLPLITSDENDVQGIYIYCENGRVFFYHRSDWSWGSGIDGGEEEIYKNTDWYQKAKAAGGRNVIRKISKEKGDYFSISKIIRNSQTGSEIGALLVISGNKKIKESCLDYQINEEDHIAVLNKDGEVQFLTNEKDSQTIKEVLPEIKKKGSQIRQFQETKYVFVCSESLRFGWQIVRYVPLKTLMQPMLWILRGVILLVIVLMMVLAWISYAISRRVSRPLTNLCAVMEHVEEGNFKVKIETYRETPYEIARLYDHFNHMTGKLLELFQRVATVEIQKRDAQLRALQSQINPHFLYNSLSIIQMKVLLNKDYESSRMISALGDMFRYSMDYEISSVPLEQEIHYVENYISLQKCRCPFPITWNNSVPQAMYGVRSLKMILQPLVENAFKHGQIGQKPGGQIHLTGSLISGGYQIIIEDNGVGIPQKQIEAILESLYKEDGSEGRIGLRNVNCRLRTYFSRESGVFLESPDHHGVRVILTVLYEEEQGKYENSNCGG